MQTPKLIHFFLLVILFSLGFSACNVSTTEVPKYVPDTEGIHAKIELIRFEQDFFGMDTNQIVSSLEQLKTKYPDFTNIYLQSVLRVPNVAQEPLIVKGYLAYKPTHYTYDTVQKVMEDMSLVETQLGELATYFEYYNYNKKIPLTKAYTHLCEYSYSRGVGDGFVPLPLDMALGQGYPPYNQLQIPLYLQRTLNKEHLVAKAAYAIAEDMVDTEADMKSNFMIDLMLYEGKKFYITDILLPTVADSVKFSFSSFQMAYCKKGELELYHHMTEEEVFYSDDMKKYAKFVAPGPFNPELALPGNSGTWLGYRMVLNFAAQQRKILKQSRPKSTARQIDQEVLKMVLKENDPQKFLQLYKPRK